MRHAWVSSFHGSWKSETTDTKAVYTRSTDQTNRVDSSRREAPASGPPVCALLATSASMGRWSVIIRRGRRTSAVERVERDADLVARRVAVWREPDGPLADGVNDSRVTKLRRCSRDVARTERDDPGTSARRGEDLDAGVLRPHH